MKISDRLERFRRGGTVTRYHTHVLHRPPNDAEHMYGVAIIADQLYLEAYGRPAPRDLLRAALYHDQAEYETGDVPGWIKKLHPKLKEVLVVIEGEIDEKLCTPTVEGELADLMKIADELEHLWTCLDERRLGNTMVDNMFPGGAGRVQKLIEKSAKHPWASVAADVLEDMVQCYQNVGSWACNSLEPS